MTLLSQSINSVLWQYGRLTKSAENFAQRVQTMDSEPLAELHYYRSRARRPLDIAQVVPVRCSFALAWMYYCMGKIHWKNGYLASAIASLGISYELDANMRHFPHYSDTVKRRAERTCAIAPPLPSRHYARAFQTNDKYLSLKWNHYLSLYDKIFADFKRRALPVSLLEIGVNNGGSLEIWREYFPKNSEIVGVDINPLCQHLVFNEGITFILGDATKEEFISEHFAEKQFDIIVDDGSHMPADVISSFKYLFPRLKWGGLYIIEDTSTAYWHGYNGSIYSKDTHIAFFQSLVHGVNFAYVEQDEYEGIKDEIDYLRQISTEVASITFYANVIVIEKFAERRATFLQDIFSQGVETVTNMFSTQERFTKNSPILRLYRR